MPYIYSHATRETTVDMNCVINMLEQYVLAKFSLRSLISIKRGSFNYSVNLHGSSVNIDCFDRQIVKLKLNEG